MERKGIISHNMSTAGSILIIMSILVTESGGKNKLDTIELSHYVPMPSLITIYGMLGVFLVFEKGEKSLKDLIKTIDIALGDKEGKLSRHKIAMIHRILEACYKERDDDRNRTDDNEGGNVSGSGSDDDNPQGGALPLQVRPS